MRILLTCILFFSLINFSWAQETTPRMDSILLEVENAEEDEKLEVWKELFRNPTKDDLPFLLPMLDRAYEDAVEIVGRDSAVIWRFNRQSYLVTKFQLNNQGFISIQLLDVMKLTADSLSIIQGEPHWTKIDWYRILGRFYYMQVDMDKAEEHYLQALKLSEDLNDKEIIFRIHVSIGLLYTFIGDYDKANDFYRKADTLLGFFSISNTEKYSYYYNKAFLHKNMEGYELANNYFEQVIDSLHLFSKSFQYRIHTDYASNLCCLGKVKECIQYLEKIKLIFEKENRDATMLTFAEEYTEALMLAGRHEEAKDWAVKTRIYYYNIQEARRNDEIQEWQAKYEANEKEAKIQLLEQQKQNTQSRLINLSLIALFTIGILSFFIYRNRNQKQQLALQLERDREIADNRDRLFSSITHDIRTPLSLMLAPLERVEKKISDDSAISDIQLARRNGKRLMELFNQILDWNKAEAKALKLNSQVGQLDFTFDALCKRFEQQANEKEVIFSQDIKMPQGQFLLDYDKLDRILSNLIGNAIKFCDSKEEVQLTAEVEQIENENHLSLVVSDHGPGIDASEHQKLFQRFEQGEQGKLKGGTGIGLALVKELVEIMNGEIQLFSEKGKGKGTTFKVKLPIELVNELPAEAFQEKQEVFTINKDSKEDRKPLMLVVEDEPELLNFLKTSLSDNYEVEIANSTTAGLNVAINRIPEIIISDWTLPDNNGDWFCQQIATNELTAHIPILILTAHSSDSNQKEALESGAVSWMNKPFDLEVLKIQLGTILKQQQRVQKNWLNKLDPEGYNIRDKSIEIDPFMQKVLDVIESSYQDEQFSVEKLAASLFLSRTQLFRKVKNITGRGPSKLINEYRLKKGRQLLMQTENTIAEVAYQVGFSDPNYFGKVYKEYFKTTPSQDLASY